MTTEITSQLPPCPLPGCEADEHHYHDVDVYAIDGAHDCAYAARLGYCCYGPHQPDLLDALVVAKGHRDSLAATLIEVQREKLALERAIERVRALHAPISKTVFDGISFVPHDTLTDCGWCDTTYPCPTIQALDGAEPAIVEADRIKQKEN